MKKSLIVLLILNVLFCIVNVYAFQVGELKIEPVATVAERYDSNLTEAHSNVLDDFISTLQFGFQVTQEGKNQSLSLSTSLRQELFAKNHSLNNLSEDFSGIYKIETSDYDHLKFDNKFLHSEDMYNFQDQFGRNTGRYDFYRNNFNSVWIHDFMEQLSVQLKYRQEYYDPNLRGSSTSIQHRPGLEADYTFNSRTIGSLYYDYSRREFDPGSSITKNTVGGGARQYLTKQLYLDAQAGVDFIQQFFGEILTRPQYVVSLGEQKDDTTFYGLSFKKEYADTSYNQDLFDSWRTTLDWQKDISQRLNVSSDIFVGGGEYTRSHIKDNLYGVGFLFTYALYEKTNLGLGYRFTDNESNSTFRAYRKSLVFININTKF